LVNCCLQTGHGLVITYVITFGFPFGLAPSVEEPMHVARQKSCVFADRAAQDSSVSNAVTTQGRVRLRPHERHYSVTELRDKSRSHCEAVLSHSP